MNRSKNKLYLKITIYVFIIVGFIVGGLNFGVGKGDNHELNEIIRHIYLLYENAFRTLIVIIAGRYSYLMIKDRANKNKMRINSMIFFSISMLILLIVIPLLTGLHEVSIALMPFPWSTMPVQVLYDQYFFGNKISDSIINSVLTIYVVYQLVIIIGTIIYGRRFHCSMICPFSGSHAETFSLAFPLLKKKKKNKKYNSNNITQKILYLFKYGLFIFAILNFFLMGLIVITDQQFISMDLLRNIELIKYVIFEVLILQVLYFSLNGRGYCNYCPAGTFLGILSRVGKQEITTNLTNCTNCKLCDRSCDMGITISEKAINGIAVTDMNCVGCGHCVDACPSNNLAYTTFFTRKFKEEGFANGLKDSLLHKNR